MDSSIDNIIRGLINEQDINLSPIDFTSSTKSCHGVAKLAQNSGLKILTQHNPASDFQIFMTSRRTR